MTDLFNFEASCMQSVSTRKMGGHRRITPGGPQDNLWIRGRADPEPLCGHEKNQEI